MDELDELRRLAEDLGTLPASSAEAVRTRLAPLFGSSETSRQSSAERRIFCRRNLGMMSAAVIVGSLFLILFVWQDTHEQPAVRVHPVVSATSSRSSPNPRGEDGVLSGGALYPPEALFDPNTPLFEGGYQVGFADAETLVDYPLYRPDLQSEPEVWAFDFSDDSIMHHEIGLRYDSSVVVLYKVFSAGDDASDMYLRQARDWGAGYVGAINSHPAWVVPREQNRLDPSASVVHIAIGEVEVELRGRMSAQDLVSLAATLHA